MSNPTPELVEGIDYYAEAGRRVSTAARHRKRGHRRANVCRHGPSGNAPADRAEAAGDATREDREPA